ncbi:receptor-type tyrosine-protein phosphatase eta [Scomber scombrus]|uniref:receptor-type tyrosine-protein phosphatase eta n=1 Tax=Scomber scombrus TaxID=13677 RepID=UPI002DD9A272|nr:receptor-type tyrosine-protein phosphatase eta [Scomber scombrus]
MKPLLRLSVSVWALLVFSALLKDSRAACADRECDNNETIIITTTTTTIEFQSKPNCSLSVSNISGNGSLVGLSPGAVYNISLDCLNCCKVVTTKPERVIDLNVTGISTTSISLSWNKPTGNISFYKVQWDGNTRNVTETSKTITQLGVGKKYTITVTAVADDGRTEGMSQVISQYTKPYVVKSLGLSEFTTSSVSLNWTKPEGNSPFYRVQWTDGTSNETVNVNETKINVTALTAGVQYNFTVTAVAGDNETVGEAKTVSQYTKPEVVRNLSVSEFTTSSVSLTWTKPEGNSSSYKVQWTGGEINGTATVTETSKIITNLTAGVQYTITVTAVADDGHTEGQSATVAQYTKPEVVRNLSVSEFTTSSVSLTWTKPEGNSSSYKVQWTGGEINGTATVTETSKIITNLTAGVQYTITVTAVADDGHTEGQSATVSQYTKPEVVRNLSVSEFTTSSVSLTWTKPEGNSSSYKVQWTGGEINGTATVTETSKIITNLTAGVQYTITVTAVADDGHTEGQSATVAQYTKPEVVRNLSVSEFTTSSVSLTWTKPEGNSSSYKVQWTGGEINGTATVTETSKIITNLTAGVQYTITVTAVADDGHTEGQSATVAQYTKPEVVRNLSVSEFTTSSVCLTWTKPEGNSPLNRVQWTDGTNNGDVNVSETKINVTALTAGVQYHFTVTAVAGDNETVGEAKTVSQYTKPDIVRDLTVSEIKTSSVSLTWTKPEGNSPSYKVQWTGGEINGTATVTETSKIITNLTAGVQYTITVTAVADDGHTEGQSATVSQYTKPEVVRNLSVSEFTTSSVSLTWTKPEGNSSSYKVQWTGGEINGTATVTETSKIITNLTAGVQYTITVTAVADDGHTEGQSATVSQYTKPEVVRNLSVSEFTTSSVSLNWTKPEGNSSSYKVQWTGGEINGTATVTETSKIITNLTAGVQYTITVTAVADDGHTEGQSATVSQYTNPEIVKSLSVSEFTTSSVSLNWTKPEGNSPFYRVQWTDGTNNGDVNVSETKINITALTAGVQYNFTVIAVAGDNETVGEAKTVSQYTKPDVVRNLTVSEITTSSLSLTWTKPEGKSSSYKVQWTGGEINVLANMTETSKIFINLTAGVQYTITVTAVADDGHTEGQSATVSQYTKPDIVRNITITAFTTSSLSLSWTKPEGNSSTYKVQWTGGNINDSCSVNVTSKTITNLAAGVHYTITVTAVAGDGHTEGQSTTVSRYTKPDIIKGLVVSTYTSAISLKWKSSGDNFKYRVQWHNGGTPEITSTNTSLAELSNLSPGTNYTITVVAIASDSKTEGDPYIFSSFTKPAVVNNLTETVVTTSSVSLTWTQPEGNTTSYIVLWTAEEKVLNSTTSETSFTINGLIPGTKYNVTVAAVAGDSSNMGEGTTTPIATRPVNPENIMVTAKGTDNLNIKWTLPEGRVDYYMVNISNENLQYSYSNTTTITTAHFTSLHPGRVFVITVTAVAGKFSNTSDQYPFATVPTPPGSIRISQVTDTLLYLQWATPIQMEGAPDISFHITYQPKGGNSQNESSTVNEKMLSLLSSGTEYHITVKTVGPQNLMSSAVSKSVFTLPKPVSNLVASPNSTTSIKVKWSLPLDVMPYYEYIVQTYNVTGTLVNNQTVNNTSTDVPDLQPGTRYNISVTTMAAQGIKSTAEQTFSYTMPKAVTNLTVTDTKPTAIQLTWLRQSDHKPSYSYLVKALLGTEVVHNNSVNVENYTFFNLIPGTPYIFEVFTVVEGVKSTVESITTYTKPEAVSDIVAIGSTTDMSVSWKLASGLVDSYTVLLYRDSQLEKNNTDLSNTTTNTVFHGLKPGVLYCVVVITRSIPSESNNSSEKCNATFPNPPGLITVKLQTVDSIKFSWAFPEDMDHSPYNFSVSTVKGSVIIQDNWFLLSGLQSGTPYNISVVTVGVQNHESTAVTAENYTRPYPVTMLRQTEITTNSVTLVWEQPDKKSYYSYVVQDTNGSLSQIRNTTYTFTGLLSGSNYSFIVTTQAADGTPADPVTVSYFTRPHNVRELQAETLNTTAIRLVWIKPQEYKDDYTYLVKTTVCGNKSKTLAEEVTEISELTPGTACTFCVFVKAKDGIEGNASCISQYTRPEAVHPSVSSQGSNSSILVSWTNPPGNVEYYMVYLASTSSGFQPQLIKSTSTSVLFESLSAGTKYTVWVISHSGPFNVSSEKITNATFPNPPGPIEIVMKTTDSITIKWMAAPLMTNGSFYYKLTNISSLGSGYINTTHNSYTFAFLDSGTSYNISVVTVGVMDFKSDRVQSWATTKPFGVRDLEASTGEKSITVKWKEPEQTKTSYSYNLTLQISDGPITYYYKIKKQEHTINDLVPGSRYTVKVITETSDGTQSDPTSISKCTNASPTKMFSYEAPNKINAELILSWTNPEGNYTGFQITGDDIPEANLKRTCNPNCSHTITGLNHYSVYNLSLKVLSCGLPSTPVSLSCKTGITKPPIAQDYEKLVAVTEKTYNKFSLQIDSKLLDDTKGPITHVGVLVANNLPKTNSSDLTIYLGKTYKQWTEKSTLVYLATVKDNNIQSRSGGNDLSIEIGDEDQYGSYSNGILKATGKYQYAIVLFTSLILENDLVNIQTSLFSITSLYSAVVLPQNPAVIGFAVGTTLGIFCILFLILIGFIVYWKRLSNKDSSDIQIHSMRSVAVRVEDYEAYYKKQKADSNCGFAEEFEDLKLVGTGQSKTSALTLENKPKNRYNNVLPYDSSRVKLSIIHGSPYDDYINANYMPGYNSRKEFIAAQGPLPTTVSDFWRMIWEKNVQTLVMLTRCNEQGRVKCEQYWNSGSRHFENITVKTTSEIPLEDWTIRDFDIKNMKTAETRTVRQFHFTAWPDHGVPETTELLISFRHLVREHMDQYSRHSPTVVHCSAGVGRTGTFIAIDRLIFQIERENIVDVYGIVHDLRMHRPLMVQTEDQYVFLNQCSMDIIRSRTGTNVDLIYQNTAALSIYENVEPKKGFQKNGYHNA